MRWNELGKFLIIALAIIGGFCVYIQPLSNSIKQGLDLQGGTHVVLQAVDTPEMKVDEDAVNRSVRIIERRVNELGLTEPVIQRQGKDRIIVELPGVKDPEKAIGMLGRTAMLHFQDERGNVVLTGSDLKDARAQISQGNQAVVGLEFNSAGADKFADLTAKNIGKQIAIVLDGEVLTAPVVQEAITGGRAQISGSRSIEDAERLAILLRSGSLPVKIEILENRTVGPTLGQDSKEKSIKAFGIGILGVFVFMILFYRLSGIVADIALLLYVMLLLLAMRYLGATLTLPGIAGIILSIGMAVDANVLIFERFKEEIRRGRTLRSAMDAGFGRAFVTIFDSNVTTLMAAAILFYLGTGPIKGFAVTLALGVLLSMFTAITVTKYLLRFLIYSNFTKNPWIFGVAAPKAEDAK
ncbi:MAG: protein translocase subunit SecD, partial [Phascolarctobacterium sp.]|nr:protein translocase subunit SecD [Phascolarctobacterium sp.]